MKSRKVGKEKNKSRKSKSFRKNRKGMKSRKKKNVEKYIYKKKLRLPLNLIYYINYCRKIS